MKEALKDIACGVVFILVVAAIFWAIFSIPAGAQTSQADSIFGALNPANSLRLGEPTETLRWDAEKWEYVMVVPPPIRGDSLFITDSTFVLLQRLNKPKFGWITDSITWVATDTTFAGDCRCEHEWVYSEPYTIASRVGEVVYRKSSRVIVCVAGYHPLSTSIKGILPTHEEDEHCPYEANEREKICRRPGCLRSVVEREMRFQHFVVPTKSEFEMLKEKQNAQHR